MWVWMSVFINNPSTTLPRQRIDRNKDKNVHMKGIFEMEQRIRISGGTGTAGEINGWAECSESLKYQKEEAGLSFSI